MKTLFFGQNRGRNVVICILVGLIEVTQAQKDNSIISRTLPIDLQQALQMARQNYPSIKAKEAGLHGSDYGVKESKTEYIPELITQNQAQYGTANGVRGAFYPAEGTAIPISGGISPGGQNWTGTFGSFSTLMMDWKFFNFGRITANVALAKAERQRANADLENEIFQHQIKVIDSYLLYLIYSKLVSVQENNLSRANIIKNVTTANVKSGLRPGVDASFAEAEYVKAEILLLESRKNKRQERIKLAELIGNSDEFIEPDSMTFFSNIPKNDTIDPDLIKNNPLLRYYESSVKQAKAKALTIQRSYLPSIGLLAAGWARGSGIDNKTNPDGSFIYNQSLSAGIPFKVYDYMVGFHFKWNISSYPKIRYQTMQQRFKAQESEFLYAEQSLKLKRSLENAEMQYDLSYQQSLKAPIQLSYARTAFNQSQGRYNSGLATLVELSQNFFVLNRAEVDLSIANNNVWRALLLKAAATGDISIFTTQAFK